MGYFDYIDNKEKKDEMTVTLDEHWAKISFFVSLGALGLFILSIILTFAVHMGVSMWFNVPNFFFFFTSIVGIVFVSITFNHFKRRRQKSAIANMALALNILWLLSHVMMIAFNMAFLYY